MSTLLIKNAYVVTMDDHSLNDRSREIPDGGLFIRNGLIEEVGPMSELPAVADEVLDLKDHVVLPGLVNTHHHFYQTLTRAVPAAQDANLFNWLKTLYPIWARLTPDDIFISTSTALAELALSGCTTASDHLYLFPNGSKLDDEIAAAQQIGLRIQASRGSMSLGESKGGLPPDSVVDTEENILKDSQRLIEKYHDAKPGAMVQIVLAPCSPFSVTSDLMKQSAKLAREYGVHLHTHLAETEDEEQFCMKMFGHRP
ncbi:MAG: amidohydrolase family protein, partial [Anaerolineales bacterium]|nr:amidohydrolase family protein [Anaerolineales bacterium]